MYCHLDCGGPLGPWECPVTRYRPKADKWFALPNIHRRGTVQCLSSPTYAVTSLLKNLTKAFEVSDQKYNQAREVTIVFYKALAAA